jgi:hypothetical protein
MMPAAAAKELPSQTVKLCCGQLQPARLSATSALGAVTYTTMMPAAAAAVAAVAAEEEQLHEHKRNTAAETHGCCAPGALAVSLLLPAQLCFTADC